MHPTLRLPRAAPLLWAALYTLLTALWSWSAAQPTPALVGPATGTVGTPYTLQMTGLTSGGGYVLNWGDGSVENFVAPAVTVSRSHTYTQPGPFTIQLGGRANVAKTVTINLPPCTISFAPNPASVGQAVTANLSNLSAGRVYNVEWGPTTSSVTASSSTASVTLAGGYAAPGTHPVRVTDVRTNTLVCTGSVVVNAPALTLSVSPPSVPVGGTVTATLGNVPASGATLDWGDGTTENVTASGNRTHAYTTAGTFTVRLTAPGRPPATAVVVVQATPLTLSVSPASVPVGGTVTATLGNVPASGTTLEWGDGSTENVSASGNRTHVYAAPGTYTVRLSAPNRTPATAVVVVTQAAPLTLRVAPTPTQIRTPVTATLGNVPASGATLDWGDGTTENVAGRATTRTHAYERPGTFQVRLSAAGLAPAVAVVVVQAPPLLLSVTPNVIRPGQTVTATVANAVPNESVAIDWGDGTPSTTLTPRPSDVTVSATHTYLKESPASGFLVRATSRIDATAPAPVIVRVPPAQLTVVKVGPRGTPTTLLPTGLVTDDRAYAYTLTFSEGPSVPAQNGVPISRVFDKAGTKIANLMLNAPAYGVSNRLLATVSFDVPDAITNLDASSAVVSGASTVNAPTEATVKQGAAATSRVTLNVTGAGTAKLRWRRTPVATEGAPSPPSDILEERVVNLNAGVNMANLTLPTSALGRFVLTIEILPATEGATSPTPRVLPAQVLSVVSAAGPKTLVVGEGDRRFEFKLEKATVSEQPNPDGTFDLLSGTASLPSLLIATNDVNDAAPKANLGPTAGGVATSVLGAKYQPLSVKLDGDTAILARGGFRLFVGSIVKKSTVSGPKDEERQRSLFIAALRPMGLRVGDVVFYPGGAELKDATLVSPDYTPVTFTSYLDLTLYGKDEMKSSKDLQTELQILVDIWTSGDPMLTAEIGAPADFMPSALAVPGARTSGPRFASLSKAAPSLDVVAFDAGAKARAGFDVAASRGVSSGVGTKVNPRIFTGEIDITELPVDLKALEKNLDAMPGVVSFPSLALYNDGDVTTPTPGDARGTAASDYYAKPVLPETKSSATGPIVESTKGGASAGGWFGTLKLGDSGVSLLSSSANIITLDLSTTRSATPLGGGSGRGSGGGEQAALLRETYAGGVGIVKMPDVGPAWQGLLWQSRALSYSFLQGTDNTNSVGGDGANSDDYAEVYSATVPVSFGLGGWNLDINEKLAKAGKFSNGWEWSTDTASVVVVRSNLLRSERSAALESNLPLLGGKGRVRGSLKWGEGGQLTEATFEQPVTWTFGYGIDGKVTVSNVSLDVSGGSKKWGKGKGATAKGKIGTDFLLRADFDLSAAVTNLKVSCSQLRVSPTTGVSAPAGSCSLPSAASIASTDLSLTSVTPTGNSLVIVTQVQLGDRPAAGSGTAAGGLTTPGNLTLSSSGESIGDYTFTSFTKGESFDLGGGVVFSVKEDTDDLRGQASTALGAGGALATFEIRRGGELDTGLGAKASMEAIFGNDAGGSYWSVRFTANNLPSPIPAGPLFIYGFTGGVAYKMSWGDLTGTGGAFNALTQAPKRSDTGFTMAAGVVASLADDTVLHFAGGLTANSDFVIQLGADLYLFTNGRTSASGYNGGKGSPNARMWVKIAPKEDLAIVGEFCVGPATQLNGDKLKCDDVKALTILSGNLSLTGRTLLGISFKNPANSYVYVGRYRPPGASGCDPNTSGPCANEYKPARVSAKIFKIYEANMYAMIGRLDPAVSPPGVVQGTKGVAVGGESHYEYSDGGSGSIGVSFASCDYSWNVYFGLGGGGDFLLTTNPNVLSGQVGYWASASVGGSFCGFGASLGADLSISGKLFLSENAGNYLDGKFSGEVRMPGPIPNIGLNFEKRINF